MKNLISLFAIVIVLGCGKSSDSVLNQKYLKEKAFFLTKFVDHFPLKIDDNIGVNIYSVTDKNGTLPLTLILTDNFNDFTKKTYIDSIISNSIARYNSNDSCLLIVDRFHNKVNVFDHILNLSKKDSTLLERKCYENKFPVPNFFDNPYSNANNENKLSEDFNLYVIEAKHGKYWKREYLKGDNYMPSKWENGYSKGIALSEEKSSIIYWFVIW